MRRAHLAGSIAATPAVVAALLLWAAAAPGADPTATTPMVAPRASAASPATPLTNSTATAAPAPAPTASPATNSATTPATNPAAPKDSLKAFQPSKDSAAAAKDTTRAKSRADTVIVAKHNFNHREQIITGSVVMTCLALILVVMNNYNPR